MEEKIHDGRVQEEPYHENAVVNKYMMVTENDRQWRYRSIDRHFHGRGIECLQRRRRDDGGGGRRRSRRCSRHRSSGGRIIRRHLLLLLVLVLLLVLEYVVKGESIFGLSSVVPETFGIATASNQKQQQSRYLLINGDNGRDHNSNGGYDDTRRMGCMQDINAKLTQIPDNVAIDYMTSMTVTELAKQRHYMATQTMYSNRDGVVDHYRDACESVAGGIFVSSDVLVLECTKTHQSNYADGEDNDAKEEPPYNFTTTDIFVNNGVCFTRGDSCQYYVDHPDDWLLDTKRLFGDSCEIRSDFATIDDVYQSLISTQRNVPYKNIDVPAFVDATPPNYNKDRQKKCMSAFKRRIFDEKYEKLNDEALYHASRTHIDLLQISIDPPPTRLVQREYYGMDDDSNDDAVHLQSYQDLCNEVNGRFDSFTSILDCLGVGGTNWNRRQTILTQNAATCFPTGAASGCDDYTMEQWRIDTLMSTISLSCTARSTGIDDERSSDVGGDKDSKQPIKVSGMSFVLTIVAGLAVASVAYRIKVQQQQQSSRGDFNNLPQDDEPVVGLAITDSHHGNEHSKNNYTDHVELGELS